MVAQWRQKVRLLKVEIYTLYLAYRDLRTPWYARLFAGLVVGYAFSPLDLIPDFIPILGLLDDLVLVPLGILLARRLIPPAVLADCRLRAEALATEPRPINWLAAGVIMAIWLAVIGLLLFLIIL
ncbi:MAG: DUF1232 domain-containing protein [Chloroflexi bacterium]|nr:DUF1232 domain-containing protein [Chloroflexota bacterium]